MASSFCQKERSHDRCGLLSPERTVHYERLNARYASDVIGDEYRLIEPLLLPARRGGRRRTTDLREVSNAILYLIRTGCPWDMLPKESISNPKPPTLIAP